MKHILKCTTALLLTLSLIMVPVFAQEDGAQESDTFVFLCPSAGVDEDGDQIPSRWYKNGAEGRKWVSKHTIGYNFVQLDGTFLDEGYAMKVTTGLFHLDRTDVEGESYAAYCCDFVHSAYGDTLYRRMNLEDADYFTDEEAAHIRGIFEHGYWLNWDETPETHLTQTQTKANQWLEERWLQENPPAQESETESLSETPPVTDPPAKPEIVDLTVDQAMTATQLAIWNFANSEEGGYTYEFFPSPIELNAENTPQASSNILLLRDYLVAQTAAYAAPEDILFSDGQFVSANAVLTTFGEVDYDLALRFKLAGPVDQSDDLTVTAALGEHTTVQVLSAGNADANGYYTLTLSGINREEAEAAQYKISLELTGSQQVNGVYFYEARDPDGNGSRRVSQNLVGKAVGSTPVSAQCEIPFELGARNVSLYKYDAGNKVSAEAEGAVTVGQEHYMPLPGAAFDLYANAGGVDVLLRTGLVSDAMGHIVVTGLADGYDYFFRETDPPAGYDSNPGTFAAPLWGNGQEEQAALVPNTKTVIYIPPTTNLTVKKAWVGDEASNRPEEISVQLLRNDTPYGVARTLSEDNNWQYTWWGLDDWYRWSVEELSAPEGYVSNTEQTGRTVTITNTYQPPEIPQDPEEPTDPEPPEPPENLPEVPENPPEPPADPPETPENPPEAPEEPPKEPPEDPGVLDDSAAQEELLPDVPQTGDRMGLWLVLAAISGMGLVGIILLSKKRSHG